MGRSSFLLLEIEKLKSAAGVGGSVKTADPKLPGIVLWDDSQRGQSLTLTTQLPVSMSRLIRLDLHANSC